MKYLISCSEISRRKKAYISLSLSLIIGFIMSSLVFHFILSIIYYFLIVIALFIIGAFSYSFFRSLSQMQINLSNQFLERVIHGVSEKYPLNKINRVKIKWTTRRTIREIYIWLSDNKSIYITALNDFKRFRNDLLEKTNQNITLQEIHEPLDFDHPLFYPILGLLISFVSVWFMRMISNLNYQNTTFCLIIFSIYLLILGGYFVIAKPISKRSGTKTKISDNIMGVFMIIAAITIFLLIF